MHNEAKTILEEILSRMGFSDFSVQQSEDGKRCAVFVNDAPFLSRQVAGFILFFYTVFPFFLS